MIPCAKKKCRRSMNLELGIDCLIKAQAAGKRRMIVESNARTDNALNAGRETGLYTRTAAAQYGNEKTQAKRINKRSRAVSVWCACFPKNDGLSMPRELPHTYPVIGGWKTNPNPETLRLPRNQVTFCRQRRIEKSILKLFAHSSQFCPTTVGRAHRGPGIRRPSLPGKPSENPFGW